MAVPGISTATVVTSGQYHSCVLLNDSSVKCWGLNSASQLGDSSSTGVAAVTVSGIGSATSLSTGRDTSCVVLISGTIQCWGSRDHGQLGDGSVTLNPAPVTVNSINSATSASTGTLHSCALLNNGTIECWGSNAFGELGNGSLFSSPSPVVVSAIGNAIAISSANAHSCALLGSGLVQCWGNNLSGQMGVSRSIATMFRAPVTVGGFTNAVAVASGRNHNCALLADSSIKCWGNNSYGQLGNGTTISSANPVTVSSINDAIALSGGGPGRHTCAIRSDGTVWCWGENTSGQLGNASFTNSTSPVTANTNGPAKMVSASSLHSCALLSSGVVQCWGSNGSGQLGDGTTTSRPSPVSVGLSGTPIAVSAGYNQSCAVLSSGSVQCWGDNSQGQLGNGTTTGSTTPVTVVGISNAVSVSSFLYQTCAVLSDGTMKCWGVNDIGELGTGDPLLSGTVSVQGPGGQGFLNLYTNLNDFGLSLVVSGGGVVTGTDINCSSNCNFSLYGVSSVTLTATPNAGSVFTGWGGACSGAGSCVVAMDAATSVTATFVSTITGPVNLLGGWNLMGNSWSQTVAVASAFGNTAVVTTVWKWDTPSGTWQFYTPSLASADLQTYAAGKGYGVLSVINPGEGYWVNAKVAGTVVVPTGITFALPEGNILTGWNLVATGNNLSPPAFNRSLSAVPPSPGVVPINLTTLWAWDNAQASWYFYAPSLDASNGLTNYIASKGYLDFAAYNKTLGNGVGFWVNRP